jgi:hypothetical protein
VAGVPWSWLPIGTGARVGSARPGPFVDLKRPVIGIVTPKLPPLTGSVVGSEGDGVIPAAQMSAGRVSEEKSHLLIPLLNTRALAAGQ